MNSRVKKNLLYWGLLLIGLCCPMISKLSHFSWVSGIAAFVWLYSFLEHSCRFRTKKELLPAAIAFTLSYCEIVVGVMGNTFAGALLAAVCGLVLYAALAAAARIMVRWNRFPATLVFPLFWLCLYFLLTAVRLPSLIRVDMMFADMTVLLQSERLIGSVGLGFAVMWLVSLLRFALANRIRWCAALPGALYLLLLVPGIIALYPETQVTQTVRAAYTTGPYIGDFLHYTNASYDTNAESLMRSVAAAARQDADILVFTEEAFALDDTDEDRFLALCSDLARENDMAVLLGLDVADTDNSDGGASANKAVLIDSSGELVGSYQKSRLIPILESGYASGDGTIPSCVLELHGKSVKISWLICYDSNFPAYVHNLDPDTDILLLPSWDWSAVTQLHANLCRTLAVENQVYVLKPTYDGLSVAVSPDGQIFCESSTDTTGFEQVQIAEIPIRSSCRTVMPADTLSPLIHAVIGTEILAFLICLMPLIASRVRNSVKTKRSGWFTALVASELTGCCADALSWLLDGAARLTAVLYVTTAVSMLVTLAMIGIFCSYLTEYIRERDRVSRLPIIIGWSFVGVALTLTLIFTFTGDLFTIENGRYIAGPLYTLYVIVNALSMLIGLIVIFLYRRSLSREDQAIAYIYMIIPVAMAVINIWVEDWSFAYPAIALSLVLVYVMLQADTVRQLEQQGAIVNYRAAHDELTGLLNRRALNEKKEELKDQAGSSGIVFCDVNGLKYTNDRFGHEAGDRLLQRFADMLSGVFRAGDLYRIGGDEFICLMPSVPEDSFSQRVDALRARARAG